MSKHDFKQLLRNYLDGKASEEELRQINRWYDTLGQDAELSFTENEQTQLKARMWANIEVQTPIETTKPLPLWRSTWRWQAAAAILVLVGFLFVKNGSFSTFFKEKNTSSSIPKGFVEERNTTDSDLQVTLSDGSQVTLLPQSSIQYPEKFKVDKREIYLSGNAFFEVTKNPAQPFFVYAGKVTTQVLGTSFWVKAANNKQVEVEVRTGQVSVFEEKNNTEIQSNIHAKTHGVVLTPNQKATYFEENQHWVTGLVPEPEPIDYQNNTPLDFKFSEEKLPKVLAHLEKTYGIEIVLSNQSLKNCAFTGDITEQPLYTKLELICRAIGAEYEVRGTTILVNGKGCE